MKEILEEVNIHTETFSIEVPFILRYSIEKAIENYEKLLKDKNNVKNIDYNVWANLISFMEETDDDMIETLDYLWKLKFTSYDCLSEDDKTILEEIIAHVRRKDFTCESIRRYLSGIAKAQEKDEAKPNAVIKAVNRTYYDLNYSDEELTNILEEYCEKKGIKASLEIDMVFLEAFGKYMICTLVNSFEFIKNYLKTWDRKNYDSIRTTAYKVLEKYKNDEDKFSEIKEILSECSSSHVYDKNLKEFVFLDGTIARHTNAVLNFVSKGKGYADWRDIPIDLYPECDKYIRENIEIKGAYDEKETLEVFEWSVV